MTGPRGGDAVRLKSPWTWGMVGTSLKLGDIGILDGPVQQDSDGFSIIFHANSFRNNTVCSSSGGPGTIWTPASELHPTGETIKVWFWKWNKYGPGAGHGEPCQLEVPLWDWIPVASERAGSPAAEGSGDALPAA